MVTIRQSDIRKYMGCRRQFFLENSLGAKRVYSERDIELSNADVGTLVHAGVAAYYDGVESWDQKIREEAETMRVERGFDALSWEVSNAKKVTLAQLMLARYVHFALMADDRYTVFDTEHSYSVPYEVGSTTVELTGHADLLLWDEAAEGIVILDHKTVANLNQTPRPNDFQLQYYAWVHWLTTGQVPIDAGHNLIKRVGMKGKAPHISRQLIAISYESIMGVQRIVDALLPEMVRDLQEPDEVKALPNYTGECSWKCRVLDLCDGMDDASDWQHMAETEYQIDRKLLDKSTLYQ